MITSTAPIRVIAADDHVMIRQGLRHTFSQHQDVSLLATVEDGRALIAATREHRPDVIVVDLKMKEMNGQDASVQILQEFPDAAIIVYSMYDSEEMIRQMRAIGIRGFVLKDGKEDELCKAVRTVHQGNEYYCTSIRNRTTQFFRTGSFGRSTNERKQDFTETELHIIRLFCQDYSVKQIAAALKIKTRMVLTHKEHIEEKMGVHGVIPIVVYAMQNWLLY